MALIIAVVIVGGGSADTARASPLQACIAAEADRLDFSGVVAVVGPAGADTYARGRLDGSSGPPIGPDTRFNLASAGKMFTAVAVAQLVDAGKMGLDDPIGRHVPGLTSETSAVTVRQLLTHSSGLGDYFTPRNLAAIQKARGVPDLLALVTGEPLEFKPGSRFQYSNSGFVLLGALVERASGERYGDYLRDHIFTPAGMTASGLDPAPAATRAVGMTAMGDSPPPGGPQRPAPEAALLGGPAGGAYSSARDMQRFFAALSAGRLIGTATLKAFTSVEIVAAPAQNGRPELDYGFGFGVGSASGHRWYGHNGGAPGVNVEAAAYPDDGATIVVLSDRDPPTASALFRRVRAMVLNPALCGA